METLVKKDVTVETTVKAPVKKVWEYWNKPSHITKWYNASDNWHAPSAENDLREGKKFKTRMESKDGREGFDFGGTYTKIKEHKTIEFSIDDGRKVKINFAEQDGKTKVTETFETETTNPAEQQRTGWQAILDNFKKYTESN